jgi:hypothetical protein
MRIAADRPDLKSRRGFFDCTRDELRALAQQDCFVGTTLFDENAIPLPTASWPPANYLFRFQPVITFPEPGWIEWKDDGTCMIEKAPSGAYEEDWRLQLGSQMFAVHLSLRGAGRATCLYVAENHAIYARDRTQKLPTDKTMQELVKAIGNDEAKLRALVDCEFSYARRSQPGGDYVIEISTLPWREGKILDCAWVESITANEPVVDRRDKEEVWTVESFWRS